jgi:hypothetical protein
MRTHLRDRHRRKWDSFKIFRIKKVNYLKDVETLLLNVHATNGNSVTGHLPAKFNLTKPFKSALEQQKKEISRIEKSLRG